MIARENGCSRRTAWREEVDSTDGFAINQSRWYDPIVGRWLSQSNPLTGNPASVGCLFAYTGEPLDTATGLQNNLNRWYDSITGRWLSQDPSGFAAGDANLYRYVGNSPTSATDPSGLGPIWSLQPTGDVTIIGVSSAYWSPSIAIQQALGNEPASPESPSYPLPPITFNPQTPTDWNQVILSTSGAVYQTAKIQFSTVNQSGQSSLPSLNSPLQGGFSAGDWTGKYNVSPSVRIDWNKVIQDCVHPKSLYQQPGPLRNPGVMLHFEIYPPGGKPSPRPANVNYRDSPPDPNFNPTPPANR